MDKLWMDGKRKATDFSKRDYEDVVHSIVNKLQVGKDKPLRVVKGE